MKRRTGRKFIEIGEKFGRLVTDENVESYLWRGVANHRQWECECDCGALHRVRADRLRSGVCRSCGCLRRETTIKHSLKHGCRRSTATTSEYNVWRDMRRRYPGEVIRSWCAGEGKGFSKFLAAVGPRPSPAHRLVRIDGLKPWSDKNCHWVQSPKRAGTPLRLFNVGSREITLRQAAEESGIKYATLWKRIKRGIPLPKAMKL